MSSAPSTCPAGRTRGRPARSTSRSRHRCTVRGHDPRAGGPASLVGHGQCEPSRAERSATAVRLAGRLVRARGGGGGAAGGHDPCCSTSPGPARRATANLTGQRKPCSSRARP